MKKAPKELRLLDVFAISSGAMISSGIFVLPGLAFAQSGPAMILAYMLAAFLIFPTMLAKAELSTAMPRSGGTYFFIDRSLGSLLGIFAGFANWFSLSFKSAFALIGLGSFAVLIFPGITELQVKLIAVAVCLLFTVFNLFSVKVAGRIQVALVLVLIAILFAYIAAGFVSTQPAYYRPFMPGGFLSLISTAGLVFVSFGGLTKIADIAEEIKDPGRNIPLGMLLSFFVVTFIYVMAVGVTIGILEPQRLSGSPVPLSLGAGQIMGKAGVIVLSLAAVTAFVTTANAGILAASRTPMAMSRDSLLPPVFSRMSRKRGTPVIAILFTSFFMLLVIIFLNIESLVKTASALMIILYLLDNVSLIIMRESKIRNYRPKYKVPLYPVLPLLTALAYLFILFNMGAVPLLISGIFFISGLLIYFFYARKKSERISALMHIIERITAKELQSTTLEDELRGIVQERDEITEDRFDRLIRNCILLDIPGSPPLETLTEKIAEAFAERWPVSKEVLIRGLKERESQSSTIVRPGLAIPHFIVPGGHCFDIMPVRCKRGVRFMKGKKPVHT
ncbi:MAG: amino acid permease, partial [Candidatus Marinimicrobia bacterium]|nr:amino acid permease [Candidatus Neomarinimicrobiota bacterium]